MKKLTTSQMAFVSAAAVVIVAGLFWSSPAYAICQSCPGQGSIDADCYTITDPCHYLEATMGSCVRVPHYNDQHQIVYYTCDGLGSQPGPECKSQPSTCGGGNNPGGGGSTADGGECTISGGACPPECMMCTQTTDIWT